jgi:hypothetical protein
LTQINKAEYAENRIGTHALELSDS